MEKWVFMAQQAIRLYLKKSFNQIGIYRRKL